MVMSGGMYKFNFELSFLIFNFVRILVYSLNYYSAADDMFWLTLSIPSKLMVIVPYFNDKMNINCTLVQCSEP